MTISTSNFIVEIFKVLKGCVPIILCKQTHTRLWCLNENIFYYTSYNNSYQLMSPLSFELLSKHWSVWILLYCILTILLYWLRHSHYWWRALACYNKRRLSSRPLSLSSSYPRRLWNPSVAGWWASPQEGRTPTVWGPSPGGSGALWPSGSPWTRSTESW